MIDVSTVLVLGVLAVVYAVIFAWQLRIFRKQRHREDS